MGTVDAQVLAMCFRLLSAKNPATVINTASAIVRQAAALVFKHAAATPSRDAGSHSHSASLHASRRLQTQGSDAAALAGAQGSAVAQANMDAERSASASLCCWANIPCTPQPPTTLLTLLQVVAHTPRVQWS